MNDGIDLGGGVLLSARPFGQPSGDFLELLIAFHGGEAAMYLHWVFDRAAWTSVVARTRAYLDTVPGRRVAARAEALAALDQFADRAEAAEVVDAKVTRAIHYDEQRVELLIGSGRRHALLVLPWATWAAVIRQAQRAWSGPAPGQT